jgi:hypothetical protein
VLLDYSSFIAFNTDHLGVRICFHLTQEQIGTALSPIYEKGVYGVKGKYRRRVRSSRGKGPNSSGVK